MFYQLYNILLTFLLILASPYFLFRSLLQEKFRKALPQRLGLFQPPPFKRPIWVHAASVGEVFCSVPLLKKIKKEFPYSKIVLTTITSTGNEAARTRVPEADRVFFLPIDHPFTIRRAIEKIQPGILLIAETELWPNLLRSCGKKGIPVVLFNGKDFPKVLSTLYPLQILLQRMYEIYLPLLNADRRRSKAHSRDRGGPQKTRTAGNLKFDQTFPSFTQEAVTDLAKTVGLHGTETILIAGSTHPGEEEVLVALYKDLKKIAPGLVLILAPRHLERLDEVEGILKKEALSWVRKTAFSPDASPPDQGHPEVILLDTMGELMGFYSLGRWSLWGEVLFPSEAIILSSPCFSRNVFSLVLICFIFLRSPVV